MRVLSELDRATKVQIGLFLAFAAIGLLLVSLFGTGTNPEGRSQATKELIEQEAVAFCKRLPDGCGEFVWRGKNKWFLRITFDPARQPTSANASGALVASGWKILEPRKARNEMACKPPLMGEVVLLARKFHE